MDCNVALSDSISLIIFNLQPATHSQVWRLHYHYQLFNPFSEASRNEGSNNSALLLWTEWKFLICHDSWWVVLRGGPVILKHPTRFHIGIHSLFNGMKSSCITGCIWLWRLLKILWFLNFTWQYMLCRLHILYPCGYWCTFCTCRLL